MPLLTARGWGVISWLHNLGGGGGGGGDQLSGIGESSAGYITWGGPSFQVYDIHIHTYYIYAMYTLRPVSPISLINPDVRMRTRHRQPRALLSV